MGQLVPTKWVYSTLKFRSLRSGQFLDCTIRYPIPNSIKNPIPLWTNHICFAYPEWCFIGPLMMAEVQILISGIHKHHLGSSEVTNRVLFAWHSRLKIATLSTNNLYVDQWKLFIPTSGWSHFVCLVMMHGPISNPTYLIHHKILTWVKCWNDLSKSMWCAYASMCLDKGTQWHPNHVAKILV